MTDLAIVLGVMFFIFCLFFVLIHSLRLGRLTLLDWSVLGMSGVYGLGWSLVAYVSKEGGNPRWEQWLLPNEHLYPVHTILAFLLLGSICLGWITFGTINHRAFPKFKVRLSDKNYESCLVQAMWFIFIISIVSQWLYTRAYGSFLGLLDYSRLIRSAIFLVDNRFSFLRPFGGLALFASYGFFGLLLLNKRSIFIWLGLFLSIPFSLYILYSWIGRIGFLTYIMTFILGMIFFSKRKPIFLLLTGFIILFLILSGTYVVSMWFNLKPADNLVVFIARELSFPYVSFFGQLDYGENLLRLFKDLFLAPIYLLPSSLWTKWVENVGQVNTALIMGAPKGEQGVTGAIPVDLLTLGLMQASIFGIFIIGVIFGVFLKILQHLIDSIQNLGIRSVFEAHIAIKIAVLGVFYAEPALVVSGNITLLFTVAMIFIFIRIPIIRLSGRHDVLLNIDNINQQK
jgi:hypothetical protein